MALRPPRPRRQRSNPFTRQLPDEAIGIVAGALLATMVARVLALALGLEQWTATWRVIHALTFWVIGPLEFLGIGDSPQLIGSLRPLDVVAGLVVSVVALYLLATRSYRSRT